MSRPDTVFVYLGDGEKDVVKEVAQALDMSQSSLLRSIAFPQIRKLGEAITKGIDPMTLRSKVMQRKSPHA